MGLQRHCAVSVLHISAMDQQFKCTTIGIDHGMVLETHDLLPCVIAARSTRFGGLHALAVDGRR